MKEPKKKIHPSVSALWKEYLAQVGNSILDKEQLPPSYYFCDNEKDANECADLVLNGIKQATAGSLWSYEKHSAPFPIVGELYIVTDWKGIAKAVVEVVKIERTPFHKITADFAYREGEGDKSLAYWKEVHQAFFEREMQDSGDEFHEKMIIVCEYFDIVYPTQKLR